MAIARNSVITAGTRASAPTLTTPASANLLANPHRRPWVRSLARNTARPAHDDSVVRKQGDVFTRSIRNRDLSRPAATPPASCADIDVDNGASWHTAVVASNSALPELTLWMRPWIGLASSPASVAARLAFAECGSRFAESWSCSRRTPIANPSSRVPLRPRPRPELAEAAVGVTKRKRHSMTNTAKLTQTECTDGASLWRSC